MIKPEKRKKWVELILKVDWEMHNNYLLRGESAVELKKKWNGALPEISVAIGDIQSFMEDNQLRAAFTVYFVPDLDRIELVNNGELVPSARSNCTTLPKQEYRLAGWLYRSATALCQRCEPLFSVK